MKVIIKKAFQGKSHGCPFEFIIDPNKTTLAKLVQHYIDNLSYEYRFDKTPYTLHSKAIPSDFVVYISGRQYRPGKSNNCLLSDVIQPDDTKNGVLTVHLNLDAYGLSNYCLNGRTTIMPKLFRSAKKTADINTFSQMSVDMSDDEMTKTAFDQGSNTAKRYKRA